MSIIEDTIKNRLRRFDLTIGQTAVLTGIRPQLLIPGLNGRIPLTNVQLERILFVLGKIERLVEIAKPFPISLSDTKQVAFLLKKLDDGDLDGLMSPLAADLSREMENAVNA